MHWREPIKDLGKMWLLIFFFVMMTVVTCTAQRDEGRLYPIKSGKLVGFIDGNGRVIIPPRFNDVSEFMEGLAPAQAPDSDKWGYIDRTGNFVIQPQFSQAYPFSEGLAEVWFEQSGGGYIDATGQLLIQGSGGFVRNGLVRIRTKEKTIFAAKSGETVLEVPDNAWQVGGGLIAFMRNQRMGFMDQVGQVIIQPSYHRVVYWTNQQFNERITAVSIGSDVNERKYGFIDRNGETVLDFQFEWAEQFFDGFALVVKDGKYGYVNTASEVAIPLQFDEAYHFSEGLAAVKVVDRWGFIDTHGRIVIAPQYLNRMWGSPIIFSEGLAAVRTESGTGFINKANEMIVSAVYHSADDFSGELALVRRFNRTTAYVNRQGEAVWSQ